MTLNLASDDLSADMRKSRMEGAKLLVLALASSAALIAVTIGALYAGRCVVNTLAWYFGSVSV